MVTIIIHTTLKFISPIIFVYSVYMLLRGHNEPGGGFVGGLLFSMATILWLMCYPNARIRKFLLRGFAPMMGSLLLYMLAVSVVPMFFGKPILTGLWSDVWAPIAGKFSSVLLFDIGVYLIVSLSAVHSYICLMQRWEGRK